jgi:signal transduction histidine kinase
MSLRIRLVILIVLVVTVVSFALSALYLDSLVNSLSTEAIERSSQASQQLNAFVLDRLNRHSPAVQPQPPDPESAKADWTAVVSSDPDITSMLERTMAISPALLEINIADSGGKILASSNPSRIGSDLSIARTFAEWQALPFYRRLVDLTTRSRDYQVAVPLGIEGQAAPLFTIQVVASTVFLRPRVLAEMERLAEVSALALLPCLLITTMLTNWTVLRPLMRIDAMIDRISQGTFRSSEAIAPQGPREFAALESKLNLLGQQYSGAKEIIKQRPSVEEKLERVANELDVASRLAAISQIMGGVAHEIKNPLNAIVLRLDLLKARASSGAPEEELIPEIDILSREVHRLDRVVKTFLDFSRPVKVHFEEIDLAALVGEVAQLMKPHAERNGVNFTCEGTLEAATMRGDADMLQQAVLNLVTNALEAMKGGGRLRIAVEKEGEFVSLLIEDNGPGIPPELRDKVFQLYFTTKERGSGIGLAMTYRAVQLHNGTVEFVSETGRGTTFRLKFPATVVQHV